MAGQAENFYHALQRTLRAEMGKTLPPLVKRWRYTRSSDFAEINLAPETARFMIRYGLLDAAAGDDARAAIHRDLLKEIERACGDSTGVAAAWLDLFAAGEYGALESGVCGDEPRCTTCELKNKCRHLATGANEARASGERLGATLANLNAESVVQLGASDLLAFLAYGEKCGAADFARVEAALKLHGGIRRLLDAGSEELRKVGFSQEAQARLAASALLCRRWAEERLQQSQRFVNGKDFYDHFHLRLRDRKKEVFYVAVLDQKNALMSEEQVSEGTLTNTLAHPREVFANAIAQRAAAIGVVHNHPSGDPTPSIADKALTKRLNSAADLLGIRLLDHVIIGDGVYFSFIEKGLL